MFLFCIYVIYQFYHFCLSAIVPTEQYAGFVNATRSGDNTLHYWFAEAENKWTSETPFLVWLNGGPVCADDFVICGICFHE